MSAPATIACLGRPLTRRALLEVVQLVSSTGASYRAIALAMGLRDHECVYHLCGGPRPLGCRGACRGEEAPNA